MNTAAPTLDAIDRALLDHLQQAVPLVERPFAELAQRVGLSEQQCLSRLRALRGEKKIIRQISAIFDTAALGYASSLVAAQVEPHHLERAAAVVSAHPGVSHNYERQHTFNLWYTLGVAPDSALGLQGTIDKLHALSGAIAARALPTLRLFKIGVRFDLGDAPRDDRPGSPSGFTESDREAARQYTLDEADRHKVRVLQQDLPLKPRPFDAWADEAQCGLDELLEAARRYVDRRQMRRFAAVLHHRQVGMRANVMGVWSVPDDQAEQQGERMAAFDAVSHCYLRPRYDDWPYNLYTMIHAHDREHAVALLDQMREATGIVESAALWTLREFKKVRLRYFTPAQADWEAQHV